MKKLIACIVSLSLILTLSLCACGSSSSYSRAADGTYEVATEEAAAADYTAETYTDEAYTDDDGWNASASGTAEDGNDESYLSGLKIIKTGNMSIETEDYDETDAIIRARITAYQGILAETTVSGTAGDRYASYTVRIPADSFDDFFYDLAGSSVVTYQSISSEDVTDQYTDLSTRLETDQKKYERLLELLDKAETLTDIYSIQSEISDVEYEIDSITGTLNGLDARVSYSTIYLDVVETTHAVALPDQQSFGAKLLAAFRNGTSGAAESLQSFALFVAGHWFGILIFLLIAAAVAALLVRRHAGRTERKQRKQGRKAKHSGEAADEQPADTGAETETSEEK